MKQLGTLLLVDDDRHLLASMADWLRRTGLRHRYGGQPGRGCMGAVERKSYELVLVDIRLGDGDGFDLLTHCRKLPATAVVMITGYGTVEAAIEADPSGGLRFPDQAAHR